MAEKKNLLHQILEYRLQVVAGAAAITHFASNLDLDKSWWNLSTEKMSILVFLGSIVVGMGTMQRDLSHLEGDLERGNLFIRNVARATSKAELLDYIRGHGAFGKAIDPHFWVKYSEALERSKLDEIAKMDILLSAIDSKIFPVEKDASYHLMHVLVKRIISRGETYYATASLGEMATEDRTAKRFLLELPTNPEYATKIERVIYVQNRKELLTLPSEAKLKLKEQMSKGAKLFFTTEKPERNFGVYGSQAVGLYDESTGRNVLDFTQAAIDKYRNKFTNSKVDPSGFQKIELSDLV
jgi:hypothetical protein